MRKPIILTLFVVVSLCFLGCEQTPPPQNLNRQANQASSKEAKSTAASGIWPYLAERQPDVVQPNLTAKNYVLIFDGSGSMDKSDCSDGRRKIDVAKEAVIEWYKTIPPEANVGLVAFHGKWTTLDLTSKKDATNFISAINSIRPDGNTPLATAVKLSYGMLTKQAQRQLGYGEYVIVAVTDGENNDQRESLKEWVIHVLQTPINIYTIGFCIKGSHSLNQPGRTIYREANNPQELRKGLQEVLAESEKFDLNVFK
ncbi:MAG: VWA domain-containing protein [bacterium]|nr:VWA domain-containing protein [bacterium]